LIIGNVGGCIGETSALALIIGGIFLIAVKIVNWRIPVSMILAIIIFGGIFWLIDPVKNPNPIFHLFAGGFLLGAFFIATDWVSSPITGKGMMIYGLLISLLIVVIRLFGGLPEEVMYSILIMNSFVPLINRYTQPIIFGTEIIVSMFLYGMPLLILIFGILLGMNIFNNAIEIKYSFFAISPVSFYFVLFFLISKVTHKKEKNLPIIISISSNKF